MSSVHRTAALWVPDWPVLAAMDAAGLTTDRQVAVLAANRVVATSASARAAGVGRGMTKRSAQQVCPDLVLLRQNPDRDARCFETVAQAVETVVAGIEILRPGLILLEPGGAARYHGSEAALVGELLEAVAEVGFEAQGAVADGLLAPILLARDLMIGATGEVTLPAAGSRQFLAPRPVSDLLAVCGDNAATGQLSQLLSLWTRLGLHTLGQLTALPAAAVTSRFGDLGRWAWQLAQGADLRPAAKRRIETDLQVAADLEPPALRVDVATFAARRLAEDLYSALTKRGLSCGRLRITAQTADGQHERVWRMDEAAAGGLSPARITDRVRWQLEGWLTSAKTRLSRDEDGAPAPIIRLTLAAEDVFPAGTHQVSLWGAGAGGDERARRSLERVQGLLGADAVLIAALQGGRHPRERIRLHAFGEANSVGEPDAVQRPLDRPWPGAVPQPAPATVIGEEMPVQLRDAAGQPVTVNQRTAALTAPPEQVCVAQGCAQCPAGTYPVSTWAGPWPTATRWWVGDAPQNWLQVLLSDGRALLLCCTTERPDQVAAWHLEAVYD